MNFNSCVTTIIVWAAAIALGFLVVYAVVLALANQRKQVENLRRRADVKGLTRTIYDSTAGEATRREAIQSLAQIGAEKPERREEIVTLLLAMFTALGGALGQAVAAALDAMDERIGETDFREMVLQQLAGMDLKGQSRSQQRLLLPLLRKFYATRTPQGKPHPAAVHALQWMGILAPDEKMFTIVLDTLRNWVNNPESGVQCEGISALTAIALSYAAPEVAEKVAEILADAQQNPECPERLAAMKSLGKLAIESRSIRLRALVTASLVIGLQDEDSLVRWSAVGLLKELNTQSDATQTRASIADALILALNNADFKVREQALDALGETYLWAETPDRLERTVKALIIAMYDGNVTISHRAAKMLAQLEPQMEAGPLHNQLDEAFMAALQSPNEEMRFLAAETLIVLYQNGRLEEGLRGMLRLLKDAVRETGVLSADNRLGKCPVCGKNVLLKHARVARRSIPDPQGESHNAYRYFCRECYRGAGGNGWPEGALLDPSGRILEDDRPPVSEPWWEAEPDE